MKILLFTTDVIPLPGLPTSGTALRTFGLAQGLRAHGHEVIVSIPRSALAGLSRSIDLGLLPAETQEEIRKLSELAFTSSNQTGIVGQVSPDVILCGHWPAVTFSAKPSQVLIVDLAGPHLLERHYQQSPNQSGAIRGKMNALAMADYYIVSGPSQRLYFLSFMLRAEISEPEKRIITITMPLDPSVPERKRLPGASDDYPHFVFGGVFLPWQDPSAGLMALNSALAERKSGRMTLIGGRHPSYKIKEGLYTKLFSNLSRNERVTVMPMLPYEQFVESLSSADVALDLMKWNLERHLAITIRSTTYLWAGLPVIYNDYADIGRLIRSYDAGWCASPGDEDGLKQIFSEIFDNPERVRTKSQNASRLAKEVFAWDRAVKPLLDLLGQPGFAQARELDIIFDFPDKAEFPLLPGKSVGQYFLCRINGLSKIECRIATNDRPVSEPIALSLYEVRDQNEVLDDKQSRLVARHVLAQDKINNNEWHALVLKPLRESAGKTYLFEISAEGSEADGSPSPWAVKGSPFPLLSMRYGETKIKNTALCFKTTCSG